MMIIMMITVTIIAAIMATMTMVITLTISKVTMTFPWNNSTTLEIPSKTLS